MALPDHIQALTDKGFRNTVDGSEMCLVERPGGAVYLMGRCVVSNAQWRRFAEAFGLALDTLFDRDEILETSIPGDYLTNPAYDDYPALCVRWEHALAYCQWTRTELPSAEQWLYAAYGDDGRRYPWGDAWASKCCRCVEDALGRSLSVEERETWEQLVVIEDSFPFPSPPTVPVQAYARGASAFGLLGCLGNVQEWCTDASGPDPDDYFQGTQRAILGGSMYWLRDDLERSNLVAFMDQDETTYSLGFRCALRLD